MRLFDWLELPVSAYFHLHLRNGDMMTAVTPIIRDGGIDMVMCVFCVCYCVVIVKSSISDQPASYLGPILPGQSRSSNHHLEAALSYEST